MNESCLCCECASLLNLWLMASRLCCHCCMCCSLPRSLTPSIYSLIHLRFVAVTAFNTHSLAHAFAFTRSLTAARSSNQHVWRCKRSSHDKCYSGQTINVFDCAFDLQAAAVAAAAAVRQQRHSIVAAETHSSIRDVLITAWLNFSKRVNSHSKN